MLEYQVLAPKGPARGAVVALHGFGANERDLLSLCLALPRDLLYVALRAPVQLPWGGYAWYPLTTLPGTAVAPPWPSHAAEQTEVESFRSALQLITTALQGVAERFGVAAEKTVLAGFSQGAAMTVATMLASSAPRLAGYAMLSGYVPGAQRSPADRLGGAPAFVAHGTDDPLLPVALGRDLRDSLEALGATVSYREYAMAHEVAEEEIEDLAGWLADVLIAPSQR